MYQELGANLRALMLACGVLFGNKTMAAEAIKAYVQALLENSSTRLLAEFCEASSASCTLCTDAQMPEERL